jgi:hypothetical protein
MMGLKRKGAERALTTAVPQGGCYRLSFSRPLVQTSARAEAILTEISLGFSQSLQKNDRIVHQLGNGHFLPDPFQFVSPCTIRCQ